MKKYSLQKQKLQRVNLNKNEAVGKKYIYTYYNGFKQIDLVNETSKPRCAFL